MWIVLGRFCCTRLSCPRLDDVGAVVARPTNQGWLNTLIISVRDWIFAPSVTMKSLKIEKLTSYRVGNFTSGKIVGKSRNVFGVGLLKIVLSNHGLGSGGMVDRKSGEYLRVPIQLPSSQHLMGPSRNIR